MIFLLLMATMLQLPQIEASEPASSSSAPSSNQFHIHNHITSSPSAGWMSKFTSMGAIPGAGIIIAAGLATYGAYRGVRYALYRFYHDKEKEARRAAKKARDEAVTFRLEQQQRDLRQTQETLAEFKAQQLAANTSQLAATAAVDQKAVALNQNLEATTDLLSGQLTKTHTDLSRDIVHSRSYLSGQIQLAKHELSSDMQNLGNTVKALQESNGQSAQQILSAVQKRIQGEPQRRLHSNSRRQLRHASVSPIRTPQQHQLMPAAASTDVQPGPSAASSSSALDRARTNFASLQQNSRGVAASEEDTRLLSFSSTHFSQPMAPSQSRPQISSPATKELEHYESGY